MLPVSSAMPRDLARRRKKAEYAAICAVGFDADPGVFRLHATEDIENHLFKVQPGTWHVLHFVRLLWTPGPAVARTIVVGVEQTLTRHGVHLGQHWYRAHLDWLDELIGGEAKALNSPTWTHTALIERLQRQADREADRFAEKGSF